MIPLIAAGVLGAASGIYNIASGIHQNNQSNKINPIRPNYQIPSAIRNNLAIATNLANTQRLPGQSIAENRIRENSANSLNAIQKSGTSGNNILNAASQINQNQNNANNDLAVQGAQMQMDNQGRLMDVNNTFAQYQDQAFDYNKNQPYMMELAKKMALKQAGAENISSGLSSLGGLATSFIGQGGGGGGFNPFAKKSMGGSSPVSGFPSNQPYA